MKLSKPVPGFGVERTATSPSLKFHLHSFVGRRITSYHPVTSYKVDKTYNLLNI